MNILFISNYKNVGGWSNAAVAHMRELVRLGHNVVARHINVGQGHREVPDIDRLQKPLEKPDLIIQHTLPHLTHVDKRAKNLIVYYGETDGMPHEWVRRINAFDGAVLSCEHMWEVAKNHDVETELFLCDIPIETPPKADPLPIKKNPRSCLFYTIADMNPRKNLPALLAAFHAEFSKSDPVELVIKVSEPENQVGQVLENISKQIKDSLRRYKENHYLQESYICGYLNDLQMAGLHAAGDVFVNTSRGEAFSIPTMEAALLGKYIIAPNHTCFKDKHILFSLVNCYESPCMGANAPPGLHTSDEDWYEIDLFDLRWHLRKAFENWQKGFNPREKPTLESTWESILEQV